MLEQTLISTFFDIMMFHQVADFGFFDLTAFIILTQAEQITNRFGIKLFEEPLQDLQKEPHSHNTTLYFPNSREEQSNLGLT